MNVVAINPEPEPDGFAAFWCLWPKHVAKLDARKAWAHMTADQQLQAIVGAASWRPVFLKDDLKFCPHAATWLRGERYEDELPDDARPTSSAHVPFAKSEGLPARGEIPESVRAMIRKITGKA